ncbi:hypothetical protein, partial [Puniceibacterium confluentis]|uniref:hypothetical protein n=1 Tax=Puniceibacterium confluentis TaxID=1958944 RepID=UPI0011B5C97F
MLRPPGPLAKEKRFPMCSPLYASLFRGLVKQLGGVDAACAVIEAALGHSVSRGSVSRIQNG